MKKLNVLFSAFIFMLALSAAFVTNATDSNVRAKNRFNPLGRIPGDCTHAQAVDQPACPGGNKNCTIGGTGPVYSLASECQSGTNPMKFQ